jgi:hypothetical protein
LVCDVFCNSLFSAFVDEENFILMFLCVIREIYLAVLQSGFEEGMVLCSFEMDDINQINRPEDVKRFIDLEAGYLYHADSKDQNDR